jgi:hypothetical protein
MPREKRSSRSNYCDLAPLGGIRRVLYVEPDGLSWVVHRASMIGEADCALLARGRLMRMVAIAQAESRRCGLPAMIVLPDGEARALPRMSQP